MKTYPTPKEPGYYWARLTENEQTGVVEVFRYLNGPLGVLSTGEFDSSLLHAWTWLSARLPEPK